MNLEAADHISGIIGAVCAVIGLGISIWAMMRTSAKRRDDVMREAIKKGYDFHYEETDPAFVIVMGGLFCLVALMVILSRF